MTYIFSSALFLSCTMRPVWQAAYTDNVANYLGDMLAAVLSCQFWVLFWVFLETNNEIFFKFYTNKLRYSMYLLFYCLSILINLMMYIKPSTWALELNTPKTVFVPIVKFEEEKTIKNLFLFFTEIF